MTVQWGEVVHSASRQPNALQLQRRSLACRLAFRPKKRGSQRPRTPVPRPNFFFLLSRMVGSSVSDWLDTRGFGRAKPFWETRAFETSPLIVALQNTGHVSGLQCPSVGSSPPRQGRSRVCCPLSGEQRIHCESTERTRSCANRHRTTEMPTACRKVAVLLFQGVIRESCFYGMQEREKMFAQR